MGITLPERACGNVHFPYLSGLYPFQGGAYVVDPRANFRPSIGEQNHSGQSPAANALLMPDALVGGYHHIVAFPLSEIQQVPVAQLGPPLLSGRLYRMLREMLAQGLWDVVIKQDSQSSPWRRDPSRRVQ